MDVKAVYKRKVTLMIDARYNQLLEPILVERFGAVDWPTEFTPRLFLAVKLHKQAVEQVARDFGIADPRTRNPNMLQMIERFAPDPASAASVIAFGDHVVTT